MHSDAAVSQEERTMPEMILYYNSTKGGVDNFDKLVQT
jgi:hypothetical protein